MTTSFKTRAAACALLATTSLVSPALAQSGSPSIYKNIDENGVDLTDGSFNFALTEETNGSGQGSIALQRIFGIAGEDDNLSVRFQRTVSNSVAMITLTFGNRREEFTGASTATSFSSRQGTGATLTKVSASEYRYTDRDAAVTLYGPPPGLTNAANNGFCSTGQESPCDLIALQTTEPNGAVTTYQWDVGENCSISGYDRNGEPVYECAQFWRQRGVSNSFGASVRFGFEQDENPTSGLPGASWHKRVAASVGDRTVAYGFPSSSVTEITDKAGRMWRLTKNANGWLAGIRRPGSTGDNITISYANTSGLVSQVTVDGVSASYSRVVSGSTATMTRTDALGKQRVVASNLTIGRPTSDRDELGRTTSFAYDTSGRLTAVTAPEGNSVQYSYDARGNVTSKVAVPKAGSALASISTSAAFPATCTSQVTCNQPTSTTDARGNVTNYSYDPTHGGVLSITAPAPSTGAVRPQTRFGYALTHGEYQLTSISECQTGVTCVGTADEVKSTIVYDAVGRVTSMSKGAGDGSLTATEAMTYDAEGNLLTVDGPLSGPEDITRYRYDAARQRIGTVSPDPDGTGALKHRAVRVTYRPDGQVSRQETGTVNSQSDADWTAFTTLETVDVAYDGNNRPLTQALVAGGATHAVAQSSYDALGRVECSAQRMNPATFNALPASACSLGTVGSFGPDRISKTVYNAAGQVSQQRLAVGTSDEAAERSISYTTNGKLATLTDAENNVTTYEYDGHDRLAKTRYPFPTKGAGSSSGTDFEQLAYDPGANVTSRRLRDGQVITFSYDALNRPSLKDLPGSEPDVTYSYDNLGRLTAASQPGKALSFTYDALSRNRTQIGPVGTVTSAYDASGRRTSLTYPGGGLTLNYDYLTTGEMRTIRENGATSGAGVLVSFAYDDLGRRTALSRGDGAVTSYGYDAASRLTSLADDFASTASDQTTTLSYNPAAQIASLTRSNDSYAWTAHASGTTASTANGLNQLVNLGGASVGSDARGNLTVDPASGKTYAFSSENLLTSSSGGTSATLTYDPLLRLDQVAGAATTRFGYDGLQAVVEANGGGTILRQYVFGEGLDQPLVQYEGTGTTDRRWLHADERGSITAVSDGTGNMLTINGYDEYGRPQLSNSGRFQYTGQMWLPEIGAYYYKARFYAPQLGRFLQTDPVGIAAGTNLYTYVSSDPVNSADPAGTTQEVIVVGRRRVEHKSGGIGAAVTGGLRGGGAASGGAADKATSRESAGGPTKAKRGCSAAKAARMAQLNGVASNLGPVAFDSASELSLLTQYFRGDTTMYRLSGAEMTQARAYVREYGNSVLGVAVRPGVAGTTERSVFFGKFASDAPLLDGLLGTATGVFREGNLVGIRDTFNFDFKDRGGYPYGLFANAGVAMIRADAATCAGNVSIPIVGG